MEWLACIKGAIEYIESHITDTINVVDVAKHVYLSPMFLQKGFSVLVGYTVTEYIRNRRLYLAACQICATDRKIIDIALDYGYETPESFCKAFSRFHGATPTEVRNGATYQLFLPINLLVTQQGGSQMNYKITKMLSLKFIGFQRVFSVENGQSEIPKFWDEINAKYAHVYQGEIPNDPYEKAVAEYGIGEYGVCIDDIGDGTYRYLIAGKYTGGEVPKGMVVYEFPMGEWAIFDCIGPMPTALQSLSNQIFGRWLVGNPHYALRGHADVEWYDCQTMDTTAPDYHSAIWLPVQAK